MRRLIAATKEYFFSLGFKTRRIIKISAVCLAAFLLFYLLCVCYLEPHQNGIGWNFVTGEIRLITKSAWNLSPPWMLISRIDIRPKRVCITSTTRAVNCKLAQFEPAAFREFMMTEGFRYYWLSNRISFNFGYDEEYRGWNDVLRGYAFSVKKYPFIKIITEYKE